MDSQEDVNKVIMGHIKDADFEALSAFYKEKELDINHPVVSGDTTSTALYWACARCSNPKLPMELLEAFSDTIDVNPGDNSPLYESAKTASFDAVSVKLIEMGADVNYQGFCDKTALMMAASRPPGDLLRALLAHPKTNLELTQENMNFNNSGGHYCLTDGTALYYAAEAREKETVFAMLEAGANAAHKDKKGNTPATMLTKGFTTCNTVLAEVLEIYAQYKEGEAKEKPADLYRRIDAKNKEAKFKMLDSGVDEDGEKLVKRDLLRLAMWARANDKPFEQVAFTFLDRLEGKESSGETAAELYARFAAE